MYQGINDNPIRFFSLTSSSSSERLMDSVEAMKFESPRELMASFRAGVARNSRVIQLQNLRIRHPLIPPFYASDQRRWNKVEVYVFLARDIFYPFPHSVMYSPLENEKLMFSSSCYSFLNGMFFISYVSFFSVSLILTFLYSILYII